MSDPTAAPDPIGVLVVDDHPVVRRGLAAIIATQPDMRVVGEVATAKEAMAAFEALRPAVMLLDLSLPDASGVEVAERLLEREPKARIIIFTSYARDEEIHSALRIGALSYLRKGAAPEDLLLAIRTAHAGQRYVPAEIGQRLAAHIGRDELSARERQVLQLVFEGHGNKQIAAALQLSELTVNVHMRNILSKLGAGSRTEAVAIALRKGILHVE